MRVGLLILGLCALPVHATEVFVTVGEFGEASFSDEATAGASVIEFVTPEQDPEALAAAAVNLERTWALARDMEASRLAREAAAAERRRQNAVAAPEPTYVAPEPRVIVGYGRRYRPYLPQDLPQDLRQDRPHGRRHHRPNGPRGPERMHEPAAPQTRKLRKPLSWPDG